MHARHNHNGGSSCGQGYFYFNIEVKFCYKKFILRRNLEFPVNKMFLDQMPTMTYALKILEYANQSFYVMS